MNNEKRLLLVVPAIAAVVAVAGCGSATPNMLSPATSPATPTTPVASSSPAVTPVAPTPTSSPTSSPTSRPHMTHMTVVHDPGRVTGSMLSGCHTRDEGRLPDPRCTPGSYDPYMTTARICAPGYRTRSYRPPTYQAARAKYEIVEPAYGQQGQHDQRDVQGELDHLVPLELGGSNDLSNLWVEVGGIPNPKDAVENRLHDEVCSGRISLREAQSRIATDWMSA